jgi:hypothetical protein
VEALVVDALAALGALEGERLGPVVGEKAELLALVAGQDVEQGADGVLDRPGPGDLYRRHPSPSWSQEPGPHLRRVQVARLC